MTYSELIKRITSIIEDSKNSIDFKKSCYFKVADNYLEEFERLIEIERVYYELFNHKEIVYNLVSLKQDILKVENASNKDTVEQLTTIIDNVSNKAPEDLVLIDDYIILKANELEFNYLSKKLHVGPYKPVPKINSEDNQQTIALEQFERINKQLVAPVEKDKSSFIKSKYQEIIRLINKGVIKKQDILKLKSIYNEAAYLELLNDLMTYHIIDESEYREYQKDDSLQEYESTVEEMLDFFKQFPKLNLELIDNYRPLVGDYLVNRVIVELVKNGEFEMSEYMIYLKQKEMTQSK